MLVERTVFQAKYGRGDVLVALFQELNRRIRDEAGGEQAPRFRILTDASETLAEVIDGTGSGSRHAELSGGTEGARQRVKGGKIGNGPGEGRSTAAVRVADGEARRGEAGAGKASTAGTAGAEAAVSTQAASRKICEKTSN